MSETLLTPPAEPAPATTEPGTQETVITPPEDKDWSKALNADGSFTRDAYDYGMPEHFKSLGAFHESYKELQRVKGAPGEEATPEQVKAFRDAHGVPEVANSEAYGLQVPDELKEVYQAENIDRIVKAANDNAHLGHTAMMQAVFKEFTTMETEALAANTAAAAAAQQATLAERAKALESDPSFAGENRTAALQTSANALNSALDALGVDPNSDEAREVASSPLMVRILHHFGSRTSQDTTNLGSPVSDLRSGEEQADDIINNPNNPEHALYHQGDERVGKKVLHLMGAR